jgi:hypothetical protein
VETTNKQADYGGVTKQCFVFTPPAEISVRKFLKWESLKSKHIMGMS